MNLDQLIINCQKERQNYPKAETSASPACVKIFKQAFSGDEQAWAALYQTFNPFVRKWIGVQNIVGPDDVVQDAWSRFAQYAPQIENLTATDNLGPLMAYLKRCVKTSLIDMIRKEKKQPNTLSDWDEIESFSQDDLFENTEISIDLVARIEQLLYDHKEKIIFHLRFSCNIPPREIFAEYSSEFKDYQEIATIIQRLTRRLRQDPILVKLRAECKKID